MFSFFTSLFQPRYKLHLRHYQIFPGSSSTVVFLHGLGDTGDLWRQTVEKLPPNTSSVSIDLLGFGNSPRPKKASYSLDEQVASIAHTLTKLKLPKPYVLVGHSLGCLISIKFTQKYPGRVMRLVLCSPPIYDYPNSDRFVKIKETILRSTYNQVSKDPTALIRLYALAKKLGIVGPSIDVNTDTIQPFIITLKESIINQNTLHDISKLKQPITILNGRVDPLTVDKNLRKLTKDYPNIAYFAVNAGHSINTTYAKTVAQLLENYEEED